MENKIIQIEEIKQIVDMVYNELESNNERGASLLDVKKCILPRILEIGKKLTEAYIEKVNEKVQSEIHHYFNCPFENKGIQRCEYISIFHFWFNRIEAS